MIIKFGRRTDVSEVLKFNTGIKPRYGNIGSTMRGCAWCSCGRCVGCMVLLENNEVVGTIETECERCGNQIDWSEADKHL